MKFTPTAGVVAGLIDNFVETCHSDKGQNRTFFELADGANEERADACISPLKIWQPGAVRI
ncbi:hypothetical protein [Rhizobium sp. 768_B6_N1_8]|uniref:hypothetical protein n=1 Tax=Rhizobium sp. 768_B6_N1_8 TaxID=3240773 RepID=UPI003F24078A